MADLRRDPVIGRWVIVEENNKSRKPDDYPKVDHTPRKQATCQFCPGREQQTPPEIEVFREEGTEANTPGWSVRVVPNKFPALKIEGNLDKQGIGIYDMSNGIGAHEVLIETPDHNKNLADFSVGEMAGVIKLYQQRAISLAKDERFKYIMIFKNYGESAGASVEHAHGQIIALPMVPKYVLEELEGARGYHKSTGRCVYCDMIKQEYEDKERIIHENDDFVAFCPYVPRYPFECWIFPKEHSSRFSSLADQACTNLAEILKDTLLKIKETLSDPSYNFYLHVTPVNYGDQESYHWHIEIIPKLTREAGFEWGTGFHIVTTSPTVAAKYLRNGTTSFNKK